MYSHIPLSPIKTQELQLEGKGKIVSRKHGAFSNLCLEHKHKALNKAWINEHTSPRKTKNASGCFSRFLTIVGLIVIVLYFFYTFFYVNSTFISTLHVMVWLYMSVS